MFPRGKIVQILMRRFREMAKRRFAGAEARAENLGRSPSVEILNNGLNPDQTGIDLEEKQRREHGREALHSPPAVFTPHIQIPPRLHHYQDESISLNDPTGIRNEQLQLPLPISSMGLPSPSKTNRTQPHSQRIPNENETGDAESSGLSFRAISYIENLILRPLADSKYELPNYRDKMVVGWGIICLRDLENDLLRIPNVSTLRELNMVTR